MALRRLTLVVPALALMLGLVALAAGAWAPSSAPPASEMFGVNVNRVFNDDFVPAHWDAPLQAIHDAGIRQARSDAFWMWAEERPPAGGVHSYRWGMLDAEAGALAKHGLHWLPVLDYSATWAATARPDYHSPPTDVNDYAAYAGAFAARYGRGGTYWEEHPDGAQPVTTYEIWNEPNGAWFWHPRPDAAAYADMYLRARAAIKKVDPKATVVVGGLSAHVRFIEAMYAARPDLRGNVDALGWHPYAPSADGAIGTVVAARRALELVGDPDVPIHLTEVGWPTSGTGKGSNIVLPDAARAAALESTVDMLARSDCGVDQVSVYTWRTPERNPADIEDWYGITHPDGSASATSEAYARVIARWEESPPDDGGRLRICGGGGS